MVGYLVARRPSQAQAPGGEAEPVIWSGRGKLGRDLALPRLREQWAESPEAQAAGVSAWKATAMAATEEGREVVEPGEQSWAGAAEAVAWACTRLGSIPPEDMERWASVACETAGVFSAWSTRVEDTPGPLAVDAATCGTWLSGSEVRLGRPATRSAIESACRREVRRPSW